MKKLSKIFLSVAMLAMTLMGNSTNIQAVKEVTLENVTHELKTINDEDLTNVTQYTEIKSLIKFKLPSNTMSGDITTISIPDELYFSNDITQTLSYEHTDGVTYPFATMYVNADDGTVTLTYLPAVEQFSNITGEMFFTNKIDYKEVESGDTLNLEFMYGNDSHVVGPLDYTFTGDSEDEISNKYNWFLEGSKRIIKNEIRVNPTGQQYTRPIVKDKLSTSFDAMTYDRNSLRIYKGDWSINDKGVWQMGPRIEIYPNNTSNFPTPIVSYNEQENSFEIDFGDHSSNGPLGQYVGEYKINYDTVASYDILPGEKVENHVDVYDETVKKFSSTVPTRMSSAGGSTSGYQYSVTLNKVDELNKALSGATFELIRDITGDVVSTVTMTSGTHTFSGLLYDNYTLREVSAPNGYLLSGVEYKITPQDFGSGTSFVVKAVNVKLTDITGTKTWVDNDNIEGYRPQAIDLILKANNVEVNGITPTWTKNGNVWTYEYKGLPVAKDGVALNYTVEEVPVDGYLTTVDGFDITNTIIEETTIIEGIKTWVDNNNQDGIRPESIELILKADGVEVTGQTPTWVKNGNVWTYEFTNLPLKSNGVKIIYTVVETPVSGYTTTQDGFNITNTHIVGTTSIKGSKTWVDNNNQDGIRPGSIDLILKADGVELTGQTPTWVKDGSVWTYEFINLPINANGVTIKYTVEEVSVDKYLTTQDGYDITNTYVSEITNISGTKTWADNNDQDGIRPENITLTLMANGQEVIGVLPTWIKEGNVWSYEFTNLPLKANGEVIKYTVEETPVSGYTLNQNGFDLINTHVVGSVSVSGVKTWEDKSNELNLRPGSITVRIYANGTEIENIVPTWIKKGNQWTYEFANLPLNKDGVKIEYTIKEDTVENYTTSYDGLNITNTLIPPTIPEVEESLPSTGVANNFFGPTLIAVGLALVIANRRKKNYGISIKSKF